MTNSPPPGANPEGDPGPISHFAGAAARSRALAFYGAEDLTPSGFYGREDAERARQGARRTVAAVKPHIPGGPAA